MIAMALAQGHIIDELQPVNATTHVSSSYVPHAA
jgi:hypothetical protein